MKHLIAGLVFFVAWGGVSTYSQTPFVSDNNTVALWHFDELSGNTVVDASSFHNNGAAYGATIVQGRFGNGRHFNGSSAFASIPNPSNGSFNFGPNQSFSIEAWFRSTAGGVQEIVRRGIAPYPGYELRLRDGHAEGEIGNRWDGTPPDTVLRITSDQLFNDGNWHLAALVRDREARKLFLYVDGLSAAPPMDDHFPYALSNQFALDIGYWVALGGVEFFNGTLDEIRISNVARHPVLAASDTVALWHFDEPSGNNIYDSSPYHNNGTAFGATIIPGEFGNARRFNGAGNYISVPNNSSFNFNSTQSFTIEAWFKTTAEDTGEIVRRGLAPAAGYALRIFEGRVQGIIGDREDSFPPHMLLRITSTDLYNDGNWHHAALVRDRAQGKLFLYVDGLQAASPLSDTFTLAITNDRPLMIGRWENSTYPTFFRGDIDEVKIIREVRHPVITTGDTVSLWHLDEQSGQNVLDSSPYRNNGIAFGTTIVPGEFGNARRFNGSGDYISVPSSSSLNFNSTQSFTIEAWFKTTAEDTGEIVRRGLAPIAGYALRVFEGRVQGIIGDREDSFPPNMLLRITSTALYNDGTWHHAALVRDRAQGKLFLYVDGVQAAPPLNDHFTLPITSDRPLMIGRWENYTYPTYFRGDIDEVKILRGARHPGIFVAPDIRVSPVLLDFGPVMINSMAEQVIDILNVGLQGTLHVTSILSNNPLFSTNTDSLSIPPGSTQTVRVRYLPMEAGADTASLYINSNDPDQPLTRIALEGRGIHLIPAPIIVSIRDIPADQGKQARVIWHRSVYDGINDSLHIQTYSLWRRVDGPLTQPYPSNGTAFTLNGCTYLYADNELWDFIVTVPAAQLQQYAYVAPTLYDSTVHSGNHWSAFRVSAHTSDGILFFSEPDSGYSVDNLPPHPPMNFSAIRIAGGVGLAWDAPSDPDIRNYAVHRSVQENFVPSSQTLIGSPSGTTYTDTQVAAFSVVYYKVSTIDSAGNSGECSEEIGLLLTGAEGGGTTPTEYALHQNYPNPFNPETIIEYDVPVESHVVLVMFDMNGQELDRLVDERKPAGSFRASWKPANLASGVYFCRIQANAYSSIKKVVYIK